MRLVCCSIIVMSLALTIASEAEVNLDNAVGIWLLDEGVGQVAKDSSANGNDGELIKNQNGWMESWANRWNSTGRTTLTVVMTRASI